VTQRFLTEHEHDVVTQLADRLLPAHDDFPGAGAAGAADYVDRILGAFTTDPPSIWAGGPYSGRHGGDGAFEEFLPLSRLEELAWRTRIEGSRGDPEREWNGPVRGWQEIYREGIAALDAGLDLDAQPELQQLLFEHACESTYGAPEYGGNRDLAGWRMIGYSGDVQPRGWSDAEVTGA
jgi:gluconate 2-dehydrogenase subunit 3-like protein